MGQAKRRGTFEQRKEEAIAAGRDRKPLTKTEQRELVEHWTTKLLVDKFINDLDEIVGPEGR